MQSLCHHCRQMRVVVSGKGTVFYLCQLAATDVRYRKYPPQPVARCSGYQSQDGPTLEAGNKRAQGEAASVDETD